MKPIQERFKRILSQHSNIKVVGTASSGFEAISLTSVLNPDIILMDIEMENRTTGIVDYMLKSANPQEIIDAVIAAHNNRSPIRPVIAEKIRREFQRMKKSEDSIMHILNILSQLTPSEIVLLDLLSQGKSRREIAKLRYVELSTIKTQIRNILKKFNKPNTQEVIKVLNEFKILDLIKEK